MGSLFDMEGPVIKYGSKLADLMLLNVVVLFCSVPIVTIGASYTAMHYVLLKMYKDEEPHVFKTFIKAFKQNFNKATVIWLSYLFVACVLILDYFFVIRPIMGKNTAFTVILIFFLLFYSMSSSWVFILQSRYENTIVKTIKNSIIIGIGNIGKTLIMIILSIAPFALSLLFPKSFPFIILLGFSLSGLLQTRIYNKVFEKLE